MSNLAMALKQAIEFVDAAVFSENPLPVSVLPENPYFGRGSSPQFAFAQNRADPTGRKDFYLIFEKGLEDYFLALDNRNVEAIRIARRCNLAAKLAQDDLGLVEFIRCDRTKTLLCLAAHEVRHRVQYQLHTALFNQTHTNQVPRCVWWGQVQTRHYQNIPNGACEFDAFFFETLLAFDLGIKRIKVSPEYLRELILMTPEQFLEREKKS